MKKIIKVLFSLLLVLGVATGCNQNPSSSTSSSVSSSADQIVDYVSEFKLDMNSSRKKLEVSVYNFIDGDTVHFNANAVSFSKGSSQPRDRTRVSCIVGRLFTV